MADLTKFVGKWEVTGSENMDEMLKVFDMEEEKRKMYSNMRFTMEYTVNGDDWAYTVHMPQGAKTFNFRLGEEFDSYTLDGRPIKSKINAEGGKFVEYHTDAADPSLNAVMVREVDGDSLTVTATVKTVSSITRHKRV
ncbi:hypothetical protein CAPTEDRAFT_20975 [Capitella teleta]|uniref:Lipocalin/cytosolic fatty-acid binding domain-containing protein n=1 Tax=Capitella teleta TaxID=283909 RepID=R7V0N8_CAPTE|nr:hypothetical protein CAPTEDRAFT_20975 [Capitella teleta]|eukprot:ELU12067.1 hypothetical protein CAPTEDRAFT_20975 [Capitella teleta]